MALRKMWVVSAGVLIVAAAAGCSGVEPLGTGSLALSWEVSPHGCDASGVQAVEVRAVGPHALVERFACEASGATFEELAPGSYRIELRGFDAAGAPAFASEPVRVDVVADEVRDVEPIRLLAAPGQVDVEWAFDNGRVCGANDVRWISLSAFDEYDYEVASGQFSCDTGGGTLADLRAGSYLIEATGHDEVQVRWRGQVPVKLARAERVSVDVRLEPVEDNAE